MTCSSASIDYHDTEKERIVTKRAHFAIIDAETAAVRVLPQREATGAPLRGDGSCKGPDGTVPSDIEALYVGAFSGDRVLRIGPGAR
jgi:hypothetical protein